MSFVWSENVGVGESIDAADVNEVKTNIDSIYTALGITRSGCASGAGWTELPVSAGDSITSAQFQQMRDAADYAHENPCTTYCSSAQSTVYVSQNGTYCNDQDSVVYGSQNSGAQAAADVYHYVSENSIANTTNYVGDNNGNHYEYCGLNYYTH